MAATTERKVRQETHLGHKFMNPQENQEAVDEKTWNHLFRITESVNVYDHIESLFIEMLSVSNI